MFQFETQSALAVDYLLLTELTNWREFIKGSANSAFFRPTLENIQVYFKLLCRSSWP